MLIGAADTSDNTKYVSFVIGSFESIKKIHQKLGFSNIHMRDMVESEKKLIIKRMDIKGDVRIVCFHFNRHVIINRLQNLLRGRIRKKGFLQEHFNRALRIQVDSIYNAFLASHNENLQSIKFECDGDMKPTFSYLGFQCRNPSITHELADIVSYCNGKNKLLDKVIERDIASKLEDEIRSRIGL